MKIEYNLLLNRRIKYQYYSYFQRISYPCFLRISSFRKTSISDFTISATICAIVYSRVHPSFFTAFAGFPSRRSTSAGRKYRGSTSTIHSPVDLLYPFSSTQIPFHSISIPTSANPHSINSRTLYVSPVARTKSSGTSCWSMSHIPFT